LKVLEKEARRGMCSNKRRTSRKQVEFEKEGRVARTLGRPQASLKTTGPRGFLWGGRSTREGLISGRRTLLKSKRVAQSEKRGGIDSSKGEGVILV